MLILQATLSPRKVDRGVGTTLLWSSSYKLDKGSHPLILYP